MALIGQTLDEFESSFYSNICNAKRIASLNIVNTPKSKRCLGFSTMSARPRPVTATVNPPLTSTPLHGPRTFLSSDGSTESLISILDHDSYESPLASEIESEPEPPPKPEVPKEKNRVGRPQKPTENMRRSQSVGQRKIYTSCDREKKELTPWEDWLIQKAKEMRLQEEKRRRKIEEEKEQARKLKEEKAEVDKKRAERAAAYLKKKEFKDRIRQNKEKQRAISAQELATAAKNDVEEKARQKVEQWLKEKSEEEKMRKEQEKEEKEKKKREEAEQRKKSEEKVKHWFSEVKKRPRSAPRSYGYSQGKLTGYYDRNAYPEPAFYNPIPWQPIHVPNQGTEKKIKKTTKKRFNPNKYL